MAAPMSSTPWWKGQRGEAYVAVQVLLFGLILFGPSGKETFPPWPAYLAGPARVGGLALLVVGIACSVAAAIGLGRNLTPLPHPRDDSSLVETGLYAWVRHPIYGGLISAGFGWALFVQSWPALAWACLLSAFFDLKSRREESWLLARFPTYAAYRRRVRKLIPFIY